MKNLNILFLFYFSVLSFIAKGQVSVTTLGSPIPTITFDGSVTTACGSAQTWTDNTTFTGWYAIRPTNRYRYYDAASGCTTIALANWASTNNASERALGLMSGSSNPCVVMLRLINNTGSTVYEANISYTGEQYIQNSNSDALLFSFKRATAAPTASTDYDLASLGWTNAGHLTFAPLKVGAATVIDGNAAGNNRCVNGKLCFATPIANGEEVWIRWTKDNGNSPALALDDISVTFNAASAEPSIATIGTSYTQNFNTTCYPDFLCNRDAGWANNCSFPGWYATLPTSGYLINNGSCTSAAALQNFGSVGSNDRTLGILSSGSGTATTAVSIQNTTGGLVNSIDISYTGEQWIAGTDEPQTLGVEYKVVSDALNHISDASGWTAIPDLDFDSPSYGAASSTATDGNNAAFRTSLSALNICANLNNNDRIWIRFTKTGTSNSHGLGLDDFSVTFNQTAPANALEITGISTGCCFQTNTPFSITVCGVNAGIIDNSFTGSITLSATGPGTLTGTLTQNASCGCVTYTDLQVNAAGTYNFSTTSGGLTPGANTTSFAAQCADAIVINEFSPDPGFNDGVGGEWIELYNPTNASVDLSCWIITDGEYVVTIPSGKSIAAGAYFLIGTSTLTTCANCDYPGMPLDVDLATCACSNLSKSIIDNPDEQIILFNASGCIRDAIIWDDNNSTDGQTGEGPLPRYKQSTIVGACGIRKISVPTYTAGGIYETTRPLGASKMSGCTSSYARVPDGANTWVNSGDNGGDDSPTPGQANDSISYKITITPSFGAPAVIYKSSAGVERYNQASTTSNNISVCSGSNITFTVQIEFYNWQKVLNDITHSFITGTGVASSVGTVAFSSITPNGSGTTTLTYTTPSINISGSGTLDINWKEEARAPNEFTGGECKYKHVLNIAQTACPLPVDLITFTATKSNNNAILKWTTVSEENTHYFVIERALNARDFVEIGRIQAAGNSSTPLDYKYIDSNLPKGIIYYRLRTVDTDGKIGYSSIVSVVNQKETIINIIPNPTTNHTTITLSKSLDTDAAMSIYDMLGVELMTETFPANQVSTNLNVSALPAGNYVLRIKGQNIAYSKLFTKK